MQALFAGLSVLGLGFLYFIAAIPTGAALGLPLWLAAVVAWLGYTAGGVLVACGGASLRDWLTKRFRIEARLARPTFVYRAWDRFGLPALALLGPVTTGPQLGALLGLALGARRGPLVLAISLGAIPWAVAFAVLTAYGVKLVR
jgi:hypothetical protein